MKKEQIRQLNVKSTGYHTLYRISRKRYLNNLNIFHTFRETLVNDYEKLRNMENISINAHFTIIGAWGVHRQQLFAINSPPKILPE